MTYRHGFEAGSYVGDPGCTLDDLVMRPEDYRRLGIETPEQRSRRMTWDNPEVVERLSTAKGDRSFSGNVIDLVKMRGKRP